MQLRDTLTFRREPRDKDLHDIAALLEGTGLFRPSEVAVAVELVQDRIEHGPMSDYHFTFADLDDGELAGYVCYGHIAVTIGSYDLYWIAVRQDLHGRGIGKALLAKAEEAMREANARNVYIETSSSEGYVGTRAFYERCGYMAECVVKDFYAPGDHKVLFSKSLVS